LLKRTIWYIFNVIFFNSPFPISVIKVQLLRLFGASVGKNCIIKPYVNIKYPWHLLIGNDVWIGEKVWIDNLALITIGDNACISQGALLLTGNHNYKKQAFDLMVSAITINEGVWIGAQALVAPGVVCNSHSILAVQSVATKNLEAYGIYQGNPAVKVKDRIIE
jgi:putative colanic acid biosynthesis acetyltransferase WcaF